MGICFAHLPPADANAPEVDAATGFAFPSLHLTAAVHPFEQPRNYWHSGTATLTGSFADAAVRLRGRGNSTWANRDKRPLRLRFDTPHALIGMTPHRDWILLANHFDPTLLRNHAAFHLSGLLGTLLYTPRSMFVHLYVNGEYLGVYEITDERDNERAGLQFHRDPARSDFFFELDAHLTHRTDEDFIRLAGRYYQLRLPPSSQWNGHLTYLEAFISRADAAIRAQDYRAIRAVLDMPSFIDFFLINEWMKNQDISAYSVFMTLRGAGDARRIHFGPVWDFDHSAGNMLHHAPPQYLHAGAHNSWFAYLLGVPEIFAQVRARWNILYTQYLPATLAHIQHTAARYYADFARNFARHDFLGTPITPTHAEVYTLLSFDAHVHFLLDYLTDRANWLHAYFNGLPLPEIFILQDRDYEAAQASFRTHYIRRNLPHFPHTEIRRNGRPIYLHEPVRLVMGQNFISLDAIYVLFSRIIENPADQPNAIVLEYTVYLPIAPLADAFGYEIHRVSGEHWLDLRER